jgi:hypothetical protein
LLRDLQASTSDSNVINCSTNPDACTWDDENFVLSSFPAVLCKNDDMLMGYCPTSK